MTSDSVVDHNVQHPKPKRTWNKATIQIQKTRKNRDDHKPKLRFIKCAETRKSAQNTNKYHLHKFHLPIYIHRAKCGVIVKEFMPPKSILIAGIVIKVLVIIAMHIATRDPSAQKSLYTTIITLHQFMCIDLYWQVLYLHNIRSVPRRKTAFSSVLSDCKTSVITRISVQSKLSLGKFDNL